MTLTKTTKINPLLKKMAILIRDVMTWKEYDPATVNTGVSVMIGRENFPQDNFKYDLVVLDQLGDSGRASGDEYFDGVDEVMSYTDRYKTTITIECLGDNAHDNANRLAGMLRSQAAFDKKMALGFTVYRVSSIADIKHLTGQQYGNRVQMSVIAEDSRTVDVETLRIDTAELTILTEDREITP